MGRYYEIYISFQFCNLYSLLYLITGLESLHLPSASFGAPAMVLMNVTVMALMLMVVLMLMMLMLMIMIFTISWQMQATW